MAPGNVSFLLGVVVLIDQKFNFLRKTNLMIRLIYPNGHIWAKRLKHITVICLIGFNLLLSDLQNHFLGMAAQTFEWSQDMVDNSFDSAAEWGEAFAINLKRIEQSRFSRVAYTLGIPKSSDVKAKIKDIKTYQVYFSEIGQSLTLICTILQCFSIFLFVSILYSCLWLGADLIWGKAKIFTCICLIIAIFINGFTFLYLEGQLHFLTFKF